MLLNTNKFAFSLAIATGTLWTICSLLVMVLPQFMTTMTEHMLHMNLPEQGLMLSTVGFFSGLISWMVMAGVFGWLVARAYNAMVEKPSNKA